MSDKLYELMDWPEIEAVVYSEESEPRRILGPRVTEDGILIQCFVPGAVHGKEDSAHKGKRDLRYGHGG